MIEQRRANFEAHGHAGPVDLDQDVIRQISFHVHILNPREWIMSVGLCIVFRHYGDRVVIAQTGPEVGGQQLSFFARTE